METMFADKTVADLGTVTDAQLMDDNSLSMTITSQNHAGNIIHFSIEETVHILKAVFDMVESVLPDTDETNITPFPKVDYDDNEPV